MMLIRAFEVALAARSDRGFQLFSSGQEAVSVGLCAALTAVDQLLSSGRSIAPALARGLDAKAVMAELLGRATGPCSGKGGRGHLAQPAAGFFGAHAVVAGNLSIAAGVALAAQFEDRGGIVACVFGDGACGSGALHETLNIAALWKLPLLLVCDNNQLSVSTPRAAALAPSKLSDLAIPFGVASVAVDGMDVLAVAAAAGDLAKGVRSGAGPAFLECLSERFASHSTATRETRSTMQMAAIRSRCPIERLVGELHAEGALAVGQLQQLDEEVEAQVAGAMTFAEVSRPPDASEVLTDVG